MAISVSEYYSWGPGWRPHCNLSVDVHEYPLHNYLYKTGFQSITYGTIVCTSTRIIL